MRPKDGISGAGGTRLIILRHWVNCLELRMTTTKRWVPYQGVPIPKKRKARTKSGMPTEKQEQFVLACWLRKQNIPFYHVPNGGSRNLIEAAQLKRLGVSAGVPDICVTKFSRKGHGGLYIELKRASGGKVSDEQKEWIQKLNQEGYLAVVCNGADEAITQVKKYLEIK